MISLIDLDDTLCDYDVYTICPLSFWTTVLTSTNPPQRERKVVSNTTHSCQSFNKSFIVWTPRSTDQKVQWASGSRSRSSCPVIWHRGLLTRTCWNPLSGGSISTTCSIWTILVNMRKTFSCSSYALHSWSLRAWLSSCSRMTTSPNPQQRRSPLSALLTNYKEAPPPPHCWCRLPLLCPHISTNLSTPTSKVEPPTPRRTQNP